MITQLTSRKADIHFISLAALENPAFKITAMLALWKNFVRVMNKCKQGQNVLLRLITFFLQWHANT